MEHLLRVLEGRRKMSDRFIQKQIHFEKKASLNIISVNKLISLMAGHRYEGDIKKFFNIDSIQNEKIVVENVLTLYNQIAAIKRNYECFTVKAQSKDIFFTRGKTKVDGIRDHQPLIFNFKEAVDEDSEILENYSGYAIYDSKAKYFEDFSMSKYANMLFDNNLDDLAEANLEYFRRLSKSNKDFNKHQSYRMVMHDNELFVRGITSLNYKEYGVDFAFVVAVLMLHKYMKQNKGNNYNITFAALNESKLEMIIASSQSKQAGDLGSVRSAISIKTNDLGGGAFTLTNIIKLDVKGSGIYLYPSSKKLAQKDISINHGRTSIKTALSEINKAEDFYGYIDYFINELSAIKTIKNPEELRKRILIKLSQPTSSLKNVSKELKELFKNPIKDVVEDFSKFLEMCKKAEELDINYDLKEKLRVIISEIILTKN
nr:hypothetical protein [uncultured Pedobacter sp.]